MLESPWTNLPAFLAALAASICALSLPFLWVGVLRGILRRMPDSVAPPPAPPPVQAPVEDDGPYRSHTPSDDTPRHELLDQIARLQAEVRRLLKENATLKAKDKERMSDQESKVLWALAANFAQLHNGLTWKKEGVAIEWNKELKLYVCTHPGTTIAEPILSLFIKKIAPIAPFKDIK